MSVILLAVQLCFFVKQHRLGKQRRYAEAAEASMACVVLGCAAGLGFFLDAIILEALLP
jgi:hypothetical protein